MLLILMLTSKGMAGVPRASLVVIAATLNQFNIPEAGLLLILGVDTFLDMGRSATNAVGNSIATAVGRQMGRRAAARGRGRGQRARARRGARPLQPRMPERPRERATLALARAARGAAAGRGAALAAAARPTPVELTGTLAKVRDDRRGHHRLPRVVDSVLLPVGARRADRLFDRAVQADRRGDRRGGGPRRSRSSGCR